MFGIAAILFMFFVFDETILHGYFATKLRKRFDVEKLKEEKNGT
jgi:hypothetical protein